MELEPRLTEAQIQGAVRELAGRISRDYADERPLLVGVLKGCFVFLADLVRELSIPVQVDFVRARSYGAGSRSTGAVEITKDVEAEIRDRHVLVIEDIADTGHTLEAVVE